jgi:cell fate (sporulation/competence/biofilm development) regulator YlbF (YheA/YmcA/DUF963 family)
VIKDKAQELGRLLGQSDDYQALKRARERVQEASDLAEKLGKLQDVTERIERNAAQGTEPGEEDLREYEKILGEVEVDPRYQSFVAAQSNFDKMMLRVNEQILEGLRKGSESSIITLG